MWSKVRRVARYSLLTGVAGGAGATAFSLYQNDGDVSALGLVRLTRAALTVTDIARTYKRVLYFKEWNDKTSVEYKRCKSAAHTEASQKLLALCCLNKGVYIKVGQHIGALEYLLPGEYVKTMKVLHSRAPQNPVEDLYKVIRKDLKKEVSWKETFFFCGFQNRTFIEFVSSHWNCLHRSTPSHWAPHPWPKSIEPP